MFLFAKDKLWITLLVASERFASLEASLRTAQKPSATTIFAAESSRVDVHLNIGFTLTHGKAVFDLGSSSAQIHSKEDSCNILKMAQLYSDDRSNNSNSIEDKDDITDTIINSLTLRMCSENENIKMYTNKDKADLSRKISSVTNGNKSRMTSKVRHVAKPTLSHNMSSTTLYNPINFLLGQTLEICEAEDMVL